MINRKGEIDIQGAPSLKISSTAIQVFVDGVIYNKNEDELIRAFEAHGIAAADQLEGSFALFIIIGKTFYFITDKANSKKIFYADLDGEWFVSNNIDCLPKQRCTISPEGFACFLANGVMLNTLTLYKEIKSARGASIHSIKEHKFSVEQYWQYHFDYSKTAHKSEDELEKELEDLLIESIREMAPAVTHAAVSLSAGYDIRGILAIVHKYTRIPEVSCFSYAATGNTKTNSDSILAKRIAEACGYSHTTYPTYTGNLVKHIIDNARLGKAITNYCDEIETWNMLAESNSYTDLIVGEECFGYFKEPLETKGKLFSLLAINGPGSIGWLKSFVDKDFYTLLNQHLAQLQDEIYERLEKYEDVDDKKDFLYFDQRMNHVLLPWRENICSQVGCVHNPLMHSKILEFINTLPPVHRHRKILFKRTIQKMFPELFAIGFATASGYTINWELEIRRNKAKLIEFVESTDSLLDSIIPKKKIVQMIKSQSSIKGIASKNKTRIIFYLRKNYKIFNVLISPFIGPLNSHVSTGYVFPDFMILRLLMIRAELQQQPE
ncbi:MAG: asparagine synthase-related protein [Cytophaga sp.]|uniref:asparagine synthase-related protein n=1 Tax=Cytophaga sp. TaxID=29535 RepID=UPI003F810E16